MTCCGYRFQRIPAHYSDDLHHIVHYLLSKNNAVRPSIETLLQNPLVLKYTLPYSDSSDPVYSVPKDIKNTHIQTPSAIASKETIQNENTDLSTHLNRSDNSPIPLVPPTTNISSRIYQNVFVKNKIEVYEDNKTKQNESYDEIYGTCVDNDSTAGNVSLKEHSNSNYEKFPPKCELHLCSAVPSCEHTSNMSATSSTQVCCSITAESSKESTELLNEFSSEQKNQMLDDTGIKKRENEQQTELFDNQMRLMRQIFNSKMHLKDILQCCSSDENIYMNSKSLLGRNLASSDKNNNQQGHLENTTKLITMNDNVSIENLDRCVLKPYLETAIDGSFRNNVHVKDDAFIPDENANNAIQENIEIFQDQHDIMARYQTLEDKINQILSIQNKNHQIKSTHGDELEFLLKVRLDRIRQHETYIKHKEKQLQSLEQSLNRREKSLALQEKMVQQKIQRAQVYLKQCKESRKSSGAKTRSVSELKDNMKQLHIDPVVRDEKEVSARNPLPLNSKLSKFNLPARKTDIHTKEVPIPQFKKLLPVDNDSSFSADPGDTSILPTMSKIDPDKVKPLKYYRHVHFEDQFTELFNDIDLNINKISNTATNSNIKNQLQTIHTRTEENSCNNNIEFTKCNRHTESVKHQSNQENIPTKLTSDALRAVRVSNTQGHSQDRNKQITKAGQSTFMVNNSIKVHDNTFHGHKTKQLCHSNHMINQRQSLVNMKLRQFVEQRQPLSNIQASDKTMTKRHSSPSGLVGPGFITSTLTNKVMHKDEQVKSAKLKTLLPSGEVNIQSSKNGDQKTNVQQESKLTGMRKHFVKSKTSQSSSNIQQCIRRSMRSKEAHNSKPSVYHNMGDGKENKPQGISKESRLSESSLQSFNLDLKQLNQHNIGLIRKQLKPLSLQNHPIKQKSNFRDVLKTRYDHLELSPLPSEVTL